MPKIIYSTMLLALCLSFASCSKDNSSNQINEPVLPEILDKGIIGTWSSPSINGDIISYVFNDDGTAIWHEQTKKGSTNVELLNYSYDKKAKKGLFLLNNKSTGLFFKYENNMILAYNQENSYTYFKRSNLKIVPPKPFTPTVIPDPSKPEPTVITPTPPPPVVSPKPEPLPIIGKWIYYYKSGLSETYIFNPDGTYLWKSSESKEVTGRYTFNILKSFGSINVAGSDRSLDFKYMDGKIILLRPFGLRMEFTKRL